MITLAGEHIAARNAIASTAPGQLYDDLLAGETILAPRKEFRHGRGNFQLHYALDGPIEWKPGGLEHFAPYLLNRIMGRYNAVLDTLGKSGLIRREIDELDNRATRVFLTNAGREAYERL